MQSLGNFLYQFGEVMAYAEFPLAFEEPPPIVQAYFDRCDEVSANPEPAPTVDDGGGDTAATAKELAEIRLAPDHPPECILV